jgi:hypothetical protein
MNLDTAAAAEAFLGCLREEQRAKAVLDFADDAERHSRFYWPSPVRGCPSATWTRPTDARAQARRVRAQPAWLRDGRGDHRPGSRARRHRGRRGFRDPAQDGAKYVHAVLRDPGGDFGDDLLPRHLHDAHGA